MERYSNARNHGSPPHACLTSNLASCEVSSASSKVPRRNASLEERYSPWFNGCGCIARWTRDVLNIIWNPLQIHLQICYLSSIRHIAGPICCQTKLEHRVGRLSPHFAARIQLTTPQRLCRGRNVVEVARREADSGTFARRVSSLSLADQRRRSRSCEVVSAFWEHLPAREDHHGGVCGRALRAVAA
jgi:hypothetical protein